MHSTPKINIDMTLLKVRNLSVTFQSPGNSIVAVDKISLEIHRGEVLAVVGESGSGKSQTALAILGLLAHNGYSEGSIMWKQTEILGLANHQLANIRAKEIAMIFQNPMTSLNPYLRVSTQMIEGLMLNNKMSKSNARDKCIDMLEIVQISNASSRFYMYPHQLSGGMQQRVMIAMALLRQPHLLIADEPTTALDVTVQAQIVELLKTVRHQFDTAIMLITHDLGLVASISDRIAIMYSGQIMETGFTEEIFSRPRHPYTKALLETAPRMDQNENNLKTIAGEPPDPAVRPTGCPFSPRCSYRLSVCTESRPALRYDQGHAHACHHSEL